MNVQLVISKTYFCLYTWFIFPIHVSLINEEWIYRQQFCQWYILCSVNDKTSCLLFIHLFFQDSAHCNCELKTFIVWQVSPQTDHRSSFWYCVWNRQKTPLHCFDHSAAMFHSCNQRGTDIRITSCIYLNCLVVCRKCWFYLHVLAVLWNCLLMKMVSLSLHELTH